MNITKVAGLDQTVPMDMEWKGNPVHIEAKKETQTPDFFKNIERFQDYPQAVADTVASWDVTIDDEGHPYPIEVPALSKLPVEFLTAVINKVSEPWTGDAKKQKSSANGSAAAAS